MRGLEPRGRARPVSEWDVDLQPPLETTKGRGMLLGLILVSVLLAALAQLTLKHGMNQVTNQGEVPLDLSQPLAAVGRVLTNPSVLGGFALFGASAVAWIVVLSWTSLSFAYPFASLTYVLILLVDRFVLDERVSALRWAGVLLIVAGIVLVSRTHQPT